jgi:exonuclease III
MFLPIERAKLDELQSNEYTDVFRYFNPELKEKYTRRSYSKNAKAKNI